MALNFPDSPTLNQIYIDSTSGFSYQWNGSVWISYSSSTVSNIQELDNISGSFNGVTTTFPLTVNGSSISPASTNQLVISLGGVIQNPTNDYYISGSNIVFTDAPISGLTFFGTVLGSALPLNTIADNTISPVKLTTGGPSWDVNGNVTITGTGSTALLVNGNARVTGILTVGTGSVTINGSTDRINVGSGLTLSSGGIVAGVVTAASYVGDGSGLTGVGITGSTNVNTTGIITAGTVSANQFIGTGDKLIFSPSVTSFSPTDGTTGVSALNRTNIVLTYDQPLIIGTGVTATLRTVSAAGTITESFNVGVSTRVTVNNQTLTIVPTNFFDYNTEYYMVLPQGTVDNYVGGNSSLLDTYNFITEAGPTASSFNPVSGATGVAVASNIVVTFNKNIRAGVGTITLRTGSASGTIVESYDVQSSNRLTFSTNTLNVDPTSNLSLNTNYFLVIPNNSVAGYAGTDTYNFTTVNVSYPLFSWGLNQFGQLGQNNTTQYSSPVQIPGTTWSSISGSRNHSVATKTDGTLWAWGVNQYGELGQNNRTYTSSPVQIPGTTWSSISAGYKHNLATKIDGTLWSWGYNLYGQLGQNIATSYISSPVQIPGTTWSSISGSRNGNYSLATKTDGTLWSWGINNQGQLGQNDRTQYSSPRQIPGTTWSSINGGSIHTLATKTDGTLWAWGLNSQGQLGQNNRTYASSPVQIPGTTWSSISGGADHSLATKTDGTLWSWGYNYNGRLGQNNQTNYSSPVQIPGTTWSSIAGYIGHSLATKTDGTLWAWGTNIQGQLGQNDRINYSSPRQIPGTTWSSINGSGLHSLARQTV